MTENEILNVLEAVRPVLTKKDLPLGLDLTNQEKELLAGYEHIYDSGISREQLTVLAGRAGISEDDLKTLDKWVNKFVKKNT